MPEKRDYRKLAPGESNSHGTRPTEEWPDLVVGSDQLEPCAKFDLGDLLLAEALQVPLLQPPISHQSRENQQ